MSNRKILVAEDTASWRRILEGCLRAACGDPDDEIVVLDTFDSAQVTLEHKGPWSLVVADIDLEQPRVGHQLVQRAVRLQIPTIVVTGHPNVTAQDAADYLQRYGVRNFHAKVSFAQDSFITDARRALEQPSVTTTILFGAANPLETDALRLDKEAREIEQAVRSSRGRRFSIVHRWALRTFDLVDALDECHPDIVHFAGHGEDGAAIVLMNRDDEPRLVDRALLLGIFRHHRQGVHLVFLNACHTEQQARMVVEHVDYAIGMNGRIEDAVAVAFATAFYRTLAQQYSVEEAFAFAKTDLAVRELAGADVPTLHGRGLDQRLA